MQDYTAILFDLDGTLRFNRPRWLEAFVAFASEQGLSLSAEQARAGERWAHAYWADTPRVQADLARYDDAGFWLNYTRQQLIGLGVNAPDEQIIHNICDAFETRYAPEPYLAPSAHNVLAALRSRGYSLGLVSNRTHALAAAVAELGLEGYFAFTLASGEINCWKPDPRIFWRACQLGSCEPARSVYVGDNYYADVVGAQAAGLLPVLYDPHDVFSQAACMRIADLDELLARFL